MTRNPIVRAWFGPGEISAVLFAGLGGQSLGELAATGRSPDIAVNHWDVAIAVHKANHPTTKHYIEDVHDVDPLEATGGRPVALLWLSPDCTHHSKAKGGKPRDQKLRALADVAIPWAEKVRPRVIMLENVPEWIDWGPLDEHDQPIQERKGEFYLAWRSSLEALGYVVETRMLRAHDYGAPTKRARRFVIARCDGKPIRWPTPTHGPMAENPYRTAGECIEWSIPCPSIFDREKPLVSKTLARVARGADKFVLRSAQPFLVCLRGTETSHIAASAHGLDEPLRTIAAQGTHHALVVPYLVHRSNGERVGQAPRIYDVQEPLGTIVAQGQKHALCAAFLAKHYSDRPTGGWNGGASLDEPMSTVTMRDHHALVAAYLCRYNGQSREQSLTEPLTTIDTRDRFALVEALPAAPDLTDEMAERALEVAAFLRAHGYDVPGQFATVTVAGIELVVWDLGMRMLVALELFRATGFPDEYKVDIEIDGKRITKTDQIKLCGNAVCPQWVDALISANFGEAA